MRSLLFIWFALLPFITSAQEENYLWPIEGAKVGSNILYAPQSYIDKEHNFAELFIGAPYGAVVIAPVDGIVSYVTLGYYRSLSYSNSWGKPDETFNSVLPKIRKSTGDEFNPQFINGRIGFSVGDGIMLWISGLEGDKAFKTGQKIKRGDTLGTVAYSYHKISEPSICVSISKNGVSSDPMAPFGIKSTFIPPKEVVKIDSLTKEKAHEDLDILFGATEELLPSLYKIVTKDEYSNLRSSMYKAIDTAKGQICTDVFRKLISRNFNSKIHDSHIYLFPYIWDKQSNQVPKMQPNAFIGWQRDTLRLYIAHEKYKEHVGKEIVEVNGLSVDSAKNLALQGFTDYDADVRSTIEWRLAINPMSGLFQQNKDGDYTFNLNLKFADSTSVFIPEINGRPTFITKFYPHLQINQHKKGYETRIINDSVAYLGISNFTLSTVALEKIGEFIDSTSKVNIPNFIVDVRNNPGGTIETLEHIFSYFATDTVAIETFSRVNKVTDYKYLDYSLNYVGTTDTLFFDFAPQDGKEGYFGMFSENILQPDSLINYKGKLYVLTNEKSVSAATLFPAMAVRSHRGMIVGRETQSAYHYITAVKYADIRLPNSTLVIRIPLVEEWFDTLVNKRVPFGRGVIPDFEIPVTHSEILSENGDVILNKALELIENGIYIGEENPFEVVILPKTEFSRFLLVGVFLVLLSGLIFIIWRIVKRKRANALHY